MTPADYRSARRKLGTQREVAELLGVSRETIQRRERKGGTISPEAALAIRAIQPTPTQKAKP